MNASSSRATLLWALVGSSVVHASLAGFVALRGHGTPDASQPVAIVLQAELAPPAAPAASLMTGEASPALLPIESLTEMPRMPPMKPLRWTRATLATPPAVAEGAFDDVRVPALLLEDRARLGDYYGRQLGEFPREIDVAARIAEKLEAQYPAAALAQGIEGSVAVWAVVGENGVADEIEIADGPPELAEAAIAAVRLARFLPARNNMKPIRFPIALEFRFAAREASARVAARTSN